jgi:hypothetical protein
MNEAGMISAHILWRNKNRAFFKKKKQNKSIEIVEVIELSSLFCKKNKTLFSSMRNSMR